MKEKVRAFQAYIRGVNRDLAIKLKPNQSSIVYSAGVDDSIGATFTGQEVYTGRVDVEQGPTYALAPFRLQQQNCSEAEIMDEVEIPFHAKNGNLGVNEKVYLSCSFKRKVNPLKNATHLQDKLTAKELFNAIESRLGPNSVSIPCSSGVALGVDLEGSAAR